MAYIGRSVDVGIFEKQVLTPDSTTTSFTLTYAVGSANSLFVVYGGVVQEPGVAYSVSGGGQTIVFSEAPATGTTLYIIYYGKQLTTPRAAGQETTKQTFSGDGTTTLFTLTDPPVVPAGIMVFVDGILQREGSGNNFVSSGSTIAFTAAPDSGAEIDVYTLVKEKVSIDTVADGSITRAKLAASFPYWDASGNVGIGAASPATKLHVSSANVSGRGQLSIEGSDVTQLTWYKGATIQANAFGDGNAFTFGTSNAIPLLIRTDSAERMRIDATGNIGIGMTPTTVNKLEIAHTGSNGLAIYRSSNYIGINANYSDGNVHSRIAASTPNISFATGGDNARAWVTPNGIALGSSIGANTTGTGISFPATTNLSSDPNTLDDYEEGTWTPILGRGTVNPTVTYVIQEGKYTKIGRQVTVHCTIQISGVSVAGSGINIIRGLPFTHDNANARYGATGVVHYNNILSTVVKSTMLYSGGFVFNNALSVNTAEVNESYVTGYLSFTATYPSDQ